MLKRPRVLYVSFDQVPAPKGAAVHIQQFAAALASAVDLTLVTVAQPSGCASSPGLAQPESCATVRHLEFPVPEENFLDRVMSFRGRLADLLRGERFDAIQFRSIWEGVVAAALGGGAALVYEANAFPSVELKYLYPAVAADRELLRKLRHQELSLLVAARRIITPSPVTARFISGLGVRPEKIRVIPNGVDPALFRPPEQEPPAPPVRLLYTGTLAPWQGLEMLYRAMRSAAAQADFHLRVVGQNRRPWERRHRRLIAKLGLHARVELCDAVSQRELAVQVAQAHICVAPLRANDRNAVQGCCPLKLLEYAAAGRAILAADLPAVRAVFEPGVQALLYNPRKVSHLRKALLQLAEDAGLRARLGLAAQARVLADYTWKAAGRKLLDCYAELLATPFPARPVTGHRAAGIVR